MKGDQLLMPPLVKEATPLPPPAYQRAQARLGPALHIDALTLVNALHLLALCRMAVRLARRQCPPPLPSGPGGAPRTYTEESLLRVSASADAVAALPTSICATGSGRGPP